MVRIVLCVALVLLVALPLGGAAVGLWLDGARPWTALPDARALDANTHRAGTYVRFEVRPGDALEVRPLPRDQGALAVLAGAPPRYVHTGLRARAEALLREGGVVEGRVAYSLPGTSRSSLEPHAPGITREGVVLVLEGEDGAVERIVALVMLALCALAILGARALYRGWRARRPAREGPGAFERWVERNEGILDALSAVTVEGFGLRWLDHHDRAPDGSTAATQWLCAAYLPIVAVRRARLQVGPERERGVPGVLHVTTTPVRRREALPRDRRRERRVLAFYYLVFVPLLVGPVFAGLAAVIIAKGRVPAWQFWLGALACLAWGIAIVAWERRRMGPGPEREGARPEGT